MEAIVFLILISISVVLSVFNMYEAILDWRYYVTSKPKQERNGVERTARFLIVINWALLVARMAFWLLALYYLDRVHPVDSFQIPTWLVYTAFILVGIMHVTSALATWLSRQIWRKHK